MSLLSRLKAAADAARARCSKYSPEKKRQLTEHARSVMAEEEERRKADHAKRREIMRKIEERWKDDV